ncbi:MAG: redoxin family protein [Gemmataceae bacterium]|nr:redoxin family protein [Gemmata sp.]MDW8196331.1 redoxin family protein [Gemmataceae bacterium]
MRSIGLASLVYSAGLFVATALAADPLPKGEITVTEVKIDGLKKAIADNKGKVVLVDFWATWCGPCKKKFPHFVATHAKYASKGLVCMSVSMDPRGKDDKYDKGEVLKFLREAKATFPNYVLLNYLQDDAAVEQFFGLEGGIPFMALFDKTGQRIWTSEQWAEKEWTEQQYHAELDKLIEAALAK